MTIQTIDGGRHYGL